MAMIDKVDGMAMKQGTIIDATLIAAPSSTMNEKGHQCHHRFAEGFAYGMKPTTVQTTTLA
jgi:IS5 family transposase